MKKTVALLLALCMVIGLMTGAMAESAAKWTEETTADGWIKVVNEGGKTLGYSPDSGVQIIEDDGYAFKDLNKNGALDPYEDWRLDVETRAADLAQQLPADMILNMMLHPSLGSTEADGSAAYIGETNLTEYMDRGLRTGLVGVVGRFSEKALATYSNTAQAYVEALDYGVPFNFSSNPGTMGFARNLALAATFDTDYTAEMFAYMAKLYRAMGITTLLGPQMDLTTEPRWNRIRDTFGEDPALSADMAKASVGALQSTFDEDGTDLGWGADSVAAMMKHWPGDGSGEGGRESHSAGGKYTVYPGEGFETILIPFVDGAMNLNTSTATVAGAMASYSIAYSDDESYGELIGTAYSEYKLGLLREFGFDGVICTDWGALDSRGWGVDAKYEPAERFAMMIEAGVDQLGGVSDIDTAAVYEALVDDLDADEALTRLQDSARRILKTVFDTGLFENPYIDVSATVSLFASDAVAAAKYDGQARSIIMLKNENNMIKAAEETAEKPTVYIPMLWNNGVGATPMDNSEPHWYLPVELADAEALYTVVTDTIGEPTGTDKDGKPAYTADDIIRASAEDIAACDFAIVFMNTPKNAGSEGKGFGHDNDTDEYFPISLQYGEYVANSAGVRGESISGDTLLKEAEDLYATFTIAEKENRSYYGQAARVANASDMEAVLYAKENLPEGAPVIAAMNIDRPVVVAEFEAAADAILVGYSVDNKVFLDVINGKIEPTGLLPLQMPANMETVEAQQEDIPRDMEVYVDAAGNAYDFAFGMNWAGVIDDERVAKYNVEPLTTLATQEFHIDE